METESFCTREKLATFAPEGFTTPNISKIANWFTSTTEPLDFTRRSEAHATEQENWLLAVGSILEPQMPDALAMPSDQAQRLDSDLDVPLHVAVGNLAIRRLGLHSLWHHRLVTDQHQRARRNPIGEPRREDGRGFHVDGHRARLAQVLLEIVVVFPDAPVGRVDSAGPVVEIHIAEHRGYGTLQTECRQGRHFG